MLIFIKGAIFKCETLPIFELIQTHFLRTTQATEAARLQRLARIPACKFVDDTKRVALQEGWGL